MDATNMEHIPDDCFDIILDKALMDTLLCNENNLNKVEDYLGEIHRVLKDTGVVIIVSHGLPLSRLDYFDQEKWIVEPVSIRQYPLESLIHLPHVFSYSPQPRLL
jgi:EEF1A lysine methyltransferase 4